MQLQVPVAPSKKFMPLASTDRSSERSTYMGSYTNNGRRHAPQERAVASPERHGSTLVPTHPLGIKPLGNAFTAKKNIRAGAGSFASLPDELLIQVIESLDSISLMRFGNTCKALYAFSRQDDLWKTICLRSRSVVSEWQGSWLSTALGVPKQSLFQLSCKGLFSDVLYRPFLCSTTSLEPYTAIIPPAHAIPRLCDLTLKDFANEWTDKPFILTDPVRSWQVFREWSTESLLERYGKIKFQAEAVDWPLKKYVDYMRDNQDESPLYLFDHSFVEKMGLKVGNGKDCQYCIPACFQEDLFDVLGNQRPDRRWLIVGPERSGSSFHKDPNATSAWNAVLRGSKYWIMFPSSPSSPAPPGVYVSEDQSEVTSPLSIVEWLLEFHAEARKTPGCMEGICEAGEVLHVPSGWWHLVVNLTPSIAVSQNFVPRNHLANTLAFLKDKPEQVSGFKSDVKDPYSLFVGMLRAKHPDLLKEGLAKLEKLQANKKRKWDDVVKVDGGEGFGFGFGDGDDEEVP